MWEKISDQFSSFFEAIEKEDIMVCSWQRKSLHGQWEAKEKSGARFLLSPSREYIQLPNSLPMGFIR